MARGRPGPALTFGIPLILAAVGGFLVWKFVLHNKDATSDAGGKGGSGGGSAVAAGDKKDPFPAPTGVEHVITLAGDPWSGYSTFRGEPKLAAELKRNGIGLHYIDDEKYYDQDARMADLQSGKLDMIVTTMDAFMQQGAKHKTGGQYPGVVVWNIDESAGGDAIFLNKDKKSFDDVSASDTVCYAAGTPSEHLWDFASLSFSHLENVKTDNGVVAKDCWDKLQAGKVQVAVLWQPFTAIAEKEGYRKVFATGPQADDVIVDIMVVNRDYLKKNGKLVQTLANSYFKVMDDYAHDEAAHIKFITDDCGDDCKGDLGLGKSVLSGIDFLTKDRNLQLWWDKRDDKTKMTKEQTLFDRTGKLLVLKKKVESNDLPEASSVLDGSVIEGLNTAELTGAKVETVVDKNDVANLVVDPNAKNDVKRNVGTLKLQPIFFPDGSAKLDQNGKSIVAGIAEKLQSFPGLCIRIYGYTVSSGDPGFNTKLSNDRAGAIAGALRETDPAAFKDARLDVRGFGPKNLVMKNGVEDADASRRTEFTLFNCLEQ